MADEQWEKWAPFLCVWKGTAHRWMTLVLTAGERQDTTKFEVRVEQGAVKRGGRGRRRRRPKRVRGDTAARSRKSPHDLKRRGIGDTLPRRIDEMRTGPFHRALEKERNGIERTIYRLKPFRRLATRDEKRAVHFLAMVTFASLFANRP